MISTKTKGLFLFALTFLAGLAAAQAGSYLVHTRLPLGEHLQVAPFLWFTYVRNEGGIFGLFPGHGAWVASFTLLVLLAIAVFLVRTRNLTWGHYLCFGLIAAGGAGNVLDRLLYGAVVDFINVQGIPHWKYVFNTADVLIHLGLWPLLLLGWFNSKAATGEEQTPAPR